MACRERTQEEVDKSSQTTSERTSMTITMPPPPENFPHFSQNAANGMQTVENFVSGHLARTPTQEFANFNRQVTTNGNEVDKSPKQLSAVGNEIKRQMETESSIDAYESSASGNILGAKSNSRDPAATSHLNHANNNGVATRNSEQLNEGPEVMGRGTIIPDPNFYTEVVYSKERPEGVIKSERAFGDIAIIHKMCIMPPEEPKMSKLKLGRKRVSSLAKKLNPRRRPRQSGRDNEARMSLRHAEADLGALTRDEARDNAEREVLNDHTNNTEDLENQTNRTTRSEENHDGMMQATNKLGTKDVAHYIKQTASSKHNSGEMILAADAHGTKELEAQVNQMTNPVASVRTCFISKSNSVKSIAPIIEDASNNTGGESAAPESVQRLQNTRELTISDPEGTTLRRTRRSDSLRNEFVHPMVEIVNLNERPHPTPDFGVPEPSALSRSSRTVTAYNFIGCNEELLRSHGILALVPEVVGYSVQDDDDDDDFGAPLCRNPSHKPSAEETRQTESEMGIDPYPNAIPMSRDAPINRENDASVDQQNNNETSLTVALTPEAILEARNLEYYISLIPTLDGKSNPEVRRICRALKDYPTKMDSISESELENDSEASQKSNLEPASLEGTLNTSESSTGVQQHRVSKPRVNRKIRRIRPRIPRKGRPSMRFEPYDKEVLTSERKQLDKPKATMISRKHPWRRIWGMTGSYKLSKRMRSDTRTR
ncbi:hypothetical protein BOTCAL_0184g00160 [Botryotinia calthae]|uniref:Uncharacterized protein n=1 Tax=Botryotinia calthae TaxID=38488 RepID=A0A4Y8D2R2_9HELO|nr:hypothetical protein BOTCAL_0184g00160 [Botryotinia calthae]